MIGNHDVIYFAIKFWVNDPNFPFGIWALIWLHRGHISKEVVFNNKIVFKNMVIFYFIMLLCSDMCTSILYSVCKLSLYGKFILPYMKSA